MTTDEKGRPMTYWGGTPTESVPQVETPPCHECGCANGYHFLHCSGYRVDQETGAPFLPPATAEQTSTGEATGGQLTSLANFQNSQPSRVAGPATADTPLDDVREQWEHGKCLGAAQAYINGLTFELTTANAKLEAARVGIDAQIEKIRVSLREQIDGNRELNAKLEAERRISETCQQALLKIRQALGLGLHSHNDLVEVIKAERKAREEAERTLEYHVGSTSLWVRDFSKLLGSSARETPQDLIVLLTSKLQRAEAAEQERDELKKHAEAMADGWTTAVHMQPYPVALYRKWRAAIAKEQPYD